jgi:uncharacterized damage-inducible protein DinB
MASAGELLAAFDREAAATRRVLERIPEERAGFRPHPRSWTLGELSLHVANIPLWAAFALERERLDLEPPGERPLEPPRFESAAATLRAFDANVRRARAALEEARDGDLAREWTLEKGGVPLARMPRAAVLRTMILDHGIHHRGQLTVYLRMCDVPVPSLYGPTADERG